MLWHNKDHVASVIQADYEVISHFRAKELACRCCGEMRFAPGFLSHLEILRLFYNAPIYPISVCRCETHNEYSSGSIHSSHLIERTRHFTGKHYGTCAIDIQSPSETLIKLAIHLGWSVGLREGLTMCHLDRIADHSKVYPDQRMFFYPGVSCETKEKWGMAFYANKPSARPGNTIA